MTQRLSSSVVIRPTWMAYGLFVLKLIALLLLAGLQTIQPAFFVDLNIPERYLQALIFFLTGQLIISFTRTTFASIYRKRRKRSGKANREGKDNFILGINQIAGIASFLVFVLTVLIIFDIDIQEALTAISIVAAAIAILSKDYVSNMINGMILMFSDQIRLGDFIRIGEDEGRITDLTLLHVHLITEDDNIVLLPNSLILTEGITNFTRRNKRLVSVNFELSMQQVESVESIAAHLKTSLEPYDQYIDPESLNVRATDIKKELIQFKVQCSMKDDNNRQVETSIRNSIIKAVVSLQPSSAS